MCYLVLNQFTVSILARWYCMLPPHCNYS